MKESKSYTLKFSASDENHMQLGISHNAPISEEEKNRLIEKASKFFSNMYAGILKRNGVQAPLGGTILIAENLEAIEIHLDENKGKDVAKQLLDGWNLAMDCLYRVEFKMNYESSVLESSLSCSHSVPESEVLFLTQMVSDFFNGFNVVDVLLNKGVSEGSLTLDGLYNCLSCNLTPKNIDNEKGITELWGEFRAKDEQPTIQNELGSISHYLDFITVRSKENTQEFFQELRQYSIDCVDATLKIPDFKYLCSDEREAENMYKTYFLERNISSLWVPLFIGSNLYCSGFETNSSKVNDAEALVGAFSIVCSFFKHDTDWFMETTLDYILENKTSLSSDALLLKFLHVAFFNNKKILDFFELTYPIDVETSLFCGIEIPSLNEYSLLSVEI